MLFFYFFFFFKQKTAYEMRISDWSSDVCSSDLVLQVGGGRVAGIDQEVAVLVRHHGTAEREPAAAGGVDELPGLGARRVLEGAAAGAAADRQIGRAHV